MKAHIDMCGFEQALKPQWPADDCYHGCCNGETAPSVPAVAASRKGGVSAKAGAAKEAAKEAMKAAGDVADKVQHCLNLAFSFSVWSCFFWHWWPLCVIKCPYHPALSAWTDAYLAKHR